jgi:hypothetical protein
MVATWLWPRSPRLVPLHQFTLAGTAADRVAVGDWNSDRVPDLCTLEDDLLRVVALTPTDRPATVWWQDPLRARLCALTNELVFSSRLHVPHTLDLTLVGLLDITGGPAEEALIVGDEGTNVTLSVIDQRGGCIRQFPLDGRIFQDKVTTNRPGRTGVEGVPRLAAASGEGPRQLLVPISTGWGLHPRGLLSFPADGGSALWNNPIAGTPRGIEFFDLGDSNGPCIALGSYAVSNGHTLPDGQSDANCYLHLFDSRGRIRWQHQVGDEYTACEPLAVRTAPDQPQSVYAWVSAAPEVRRPAGKAPVGQILRFDGQKRELSRYDAGACLWTCLAADLDGDGTDEIYATDTAGFLHVLGPDLSAQKLPLTTNLVSSLRTPLAAAAERRSSQPTRAADPDYVALRLMGVGQFPGAKNPCLVLSSWIREVVVNATPDHRPGDPTVIHARQLEIVVLDARLRTVLRHPFAPLSVHPPGTRWLRLADFNRDGFTELLALTDDKATVYAVR